MHAFDHWYQGEFWLAMLPVAWTTCLVAWRLAAWSIMIQCWQCHNQGPAASSRQPGPLYRDSQGAWSKWTLSAFGITTKMGDDSDSTNSNSNNNYIWSCTIKPSEKFYHGPAIHEGDTHHSVEVAQYLHLWIVLYNMYGLHSNNNNNKLFITYNYYSLLQSHMIDNYRLPN